MFWFVIKTCGNEKLYSRFKYLIISGFLKIKIPSKNLGIFSRYFEANPNIQGNVIGVFRFWGEIP